MPPTEGIPQPGKRNSPETAKNQSNEHRCLSSTPRTNQSRRENPKKKKTNQSSHHPNPISPPFLCFTPTSTLLDDFNPTNKTAPNQILSVPSPPQEEEDDDDEGERECGEGGWIGTRRMARHTQRKNESPRELRKLDSTKQQQLLLLLIPPHAHHHHHHGLLVVTTNLASPFPNSFRSSRSLSRATEVAAFLGLGLSGGALFFTGFGDTATQGEVTTVLEREAASWLFLGFDPVELLVGCRSSHAVGSLTCEPYSPSGPHISEQYGTCSTGEDLNCCWWEWD